ncbi:hypothetical protein PIB30_011580 [Stylosanthes scabra]|uniref:Stress-response A/B barrel domain-containing protein n=1 Tax=Stylosanthes scabra TaxID=79078 RepID=A0ABU6U4M7_9FABA|nr:hypothetical protein [Stylosanthes scabra]
MGLSCSGKKRLERKLNASIIILVMSKKKKIIILVKIPLLAAAIRLRCKMLSLRSHLSVPSLTFSSSKHLLRQHLKPYAYSSNTITGASIKMTSSSTPTQSVVEHIVLFKVKDNTDPSKVSAMVNGLNSLLSLDQVLHLTMGPVLRSRSSSLTFTHMLHSRYATKQDLDAYSAHPSHVSVVKGNVLPIIDDIMAIDWVSPALPAADIVTPPGSAIRLSFLKLKENAGDHAKDEILGVIGGMKESFKEISQLSVGENFSPARAKGYSIASLGVFPGVEELETVVSKEDVVNAEKDKVRDRIESVVVVDYVVPTTPSASL